MVQRGGDWAGPQPPRPLLAVPNITAHPSTASVPITILLYNGPLLCGFNVPFNGLKVDTSCYRLSKVLEVETQPAMAHTWSGIRTVDNEVGRVVE